LGGRKALRTYLIGTIEKQPNKNNLTHITYSRHQNNETNKTSKLLEELAQKKYSSTKNTTNPVNWKIRPVYFKINHTKVELRIKTHPTTTQTTQQGL
jgi:hypothetical protein